MLIYWNIPVSLVLNELKQPFVIVNTKEKHLHCFQHTGFKYLLTRNSWKARRIVIDYLEEILPVALKRDPYVVVLCVELFVSWTSTRFNFCQILKIGTIDLNNGIYICPDVNSYIIGRIKWL